MERLNPPPKRAAERFEMLLPVRYHLSDSGPWVDTTTINVSRKGILVTNGEAVVPVGPIEFVLALPPCGVVRLARIRCSGRVVRVAGPTAFALSIDRYRFVKPGEAEEAVEGVRR